MGKGEKLAVILLGLFIAFVALWQSNDYFISTCVAPEIAADILSLCFLVSLELLDSSLSR